MKVECDKYILKPNKNISRLAENGKPLLIKQNFGQVIQAIVNSIYIVKNKRASTPYPS